MSKNSAAPYLVDVGHLGIQSAESLRILLLDYMKSTADIVLDLSRVETCDPIGLQLLYSCQKSAAEAGQSFTTTNCTPALKELVESLGLQQEPLPGLQGDE